MFKVIAVLALVAWVSAKPESAEKPDGRPVIKYTGEEGEKIYGSIRECAGGEENGERLMKIVEAGKWLDDDEFKTFINCSFVKSGYASEKDGKVDIKKLATLFPEPEEMLKVLEQCDKEHTPVETTFEFFKCFQKNSLYLVGYQ